MATPSSSSSSLPMRRAFPVASGPAVAPKTPAAASSIPTGPSEAQLMPPPPVPRKGLRPDAPPSSVASSTTPVPTGPVSLMDLRGCSDVSMLHCATQNMVLRLHDAIWCLADRPAGEGALNRDALTTSGYAHDLVQASRSFESLIEQLPASIRRPPSVQEQERELNELLEAQQTADKELEILQKKLQSLQDEVGQQLRHVCEEITQGCVNVSNTEPSDAAAPSSSTSHSQSLHWAGGPHSQQQHSQHSHQLHSSSSMPSSPGPGQLTPLLSPSPWGQTTQASLVDLNARRARLKVKSQEKRPYPELENAFPDQGRRFLEELEFLEMLANPDYVHWLAQQPYFSDPAFVGFLKYLMYWRTSPFVRWVEYPQALRMLEMLCDDRIRTQIHRPEARIHLFKSLMRTWAFSPEEFLKPEFDAGRRAQSWKRLPEPPTDLSEAMQAVLKRPPPQSDHQNADGVDVRQDWAMFGKEALIEWIKIKSMDPKKQQQLGFGKPDLEAKQYNFTEGQVLKPARRAPQSDEGLERFKSDKNLQKILGKRREPGAGVAAGRPSEAAEIASGAGAGSQARRSYDAVAASAAGAPSSKRR